MNPPPPLSPDAILLTAVKFGLFTTLGDRRLTGAQLGGELGLHPRGLADFFDALVSMSFLDRAGDGTDGLYFNTPAGLHFLDRRIHHAGPSSAAIAYK